MSGGEPSLLPPPPPAASVAALADEDNAPPPPPPQQEGVGNADPLPLPPPPPPPPPPPSSAYPDDDWFRATLTREGCVIEAGAKCRLWAVPASVTLGMLGGGGGGGGGGGSNVPPFRQDYSVIVASCIEPGRLLLEVPCTCLLCVSSHLLYPPTHLIQSIV